MLGLKIVNGLYHFHSPTSTTRQQLTLGTSLLKESMRKYRLLPHSGKTQRVDPTIPLHAGLTPKA